MKRKEKQQKKNSNQDWQLSFAGSIGSALSAIALCSIICCLVVEFNFQKTRVGKSFAFASGAIETLGKIRVRGCKKEGIISTGEDELLYFRVTMMR